MSTKRISDPPIPMNKMPRGPNGRRLCRWCSTEVPKGRVTFCKQICVDEYNLRRSPAAQRHAVYCRDQGVCADCGFDAGKLERILKHAQYSDTWRSNHHPAYYWKRDLLRQIGLVPDQSLWEAAHIVEVVDGGGECGLDNLRTLCRECHKRKTAESRRRRARQRRDADRGLLPV